jgi:O-methyltransferase
VTGAPELTSSREIRATGPGPDAETLRTAYLELLKLSLCDLAGSHTLTVSRTTRDRDPERPLFMRELEEEELWVRAQGFDWPWSGLTMVGLARLDDLQACIEKIVADGVEGDVIEAGVWRGGASILVRATLDSLGERDRTLWLADSFQGLPEPDDAFPEDRSLDLSWIGFLAIPADEVRAYFARFGCERGIKLVEGYFDESLPALAGRTWSMVRIDADTYESTWTALESLYPGLSKGGHLIVDDYQAVESCRAAVDDFRSTHGIKEPIEKIDRVAVRWRRESGAPVRADQASGAGRTARAKGSKRSAGTKVETHVPTLREVELEGELRQLRGRMAALEAESQATLLSRISRKLRRGLGR